MKGFSMYMEFTRLFLTLREEVTSLFGDYSCSEWSGATISEVMAVNTIIIPINELLHLPRGVSMRDLICSDWFAGLYNFNNVRWNS